MFNMFICNINNNNNMIPLLYIFKYITVLISHATNTVVVMKNKSNY